MRAPTNNKITQTKHGDYNAVDYSYMPDSNIYAPEDGTVTLYANDPTCGNNLQITSGQRRHGFCHLESASVKVGQKVKKGQKVGVMGYTGTTIPIGPNGRHLHWVVALGSTYIYPPSLINEEEDDMYKGHDAKYWYNKFIAVEKAQKQTSKVAEARAKVISSIKSALGIK